MANSPEVYDRFNRPPTRGTLFGESRTHGEFAAECDINNIMAKYLKGGTIAARTDMARFGDFSNGVDFHEAQNLIIKARGQFGALSSRVREKFGNDPGNFLNWIHDKSRKAEDFADIGLDMSDEFKARKAASAKAEPPPVVPNVK